MVEGAGFEPAKGGARGIYSPLPLAAWLPLLPHSLRLYYKPL